VKDYTVRAARAAGAHVADARDQPHVTPLAEGKTYDRVKDAGGAMDADARTRASHFGGQGERPIEPEWLTVDRCV
jgi:hypothetical protein